MSVQRTGGLFVRTLRREYGLVGMVSLSEVDDAAESASDGGRLGVFRCAGILVNYVVEENESFVVTQKNV